MSETDLKQHLWNIFLEEYKEFPHNEGCSGCWNEMGKYLRFILYSMCIDLKAPFTTIYLSPVMMEGMCDHAITHVLELMRGYGYEPKFLESVEEMEHISKEILHFDWWKFIIESK